MIGLDVPPIGTAVGADATTESGRKVRFIDRADIPAAMRRRPRAQPEPEGEGFGRVPVEAQAMGVPVMRPRSARPRKPCWMTNRLAVPVAMRRRCGDDRAGAVAVPDERRAMAK